MTASRENLVAKDRSSIHGPECGRISRWVVVSIGYTR
jgi:hypothetical protein